MVPVGKINNMQSGLSSIVLNNAQPAHAPWIHTDPTTQRQDVISETTVGFEPDRVYNPSAPSLAQYKPRQKPKPRKRTPKKATVTRKAKQSKRQTKKTPVRRTAQKQKKTPKRR